ncbi:MAG: type II toxin-antitoxin system VapC family toxin [Acidimicrobiales bacterium]
MTAATLALDTSALLHRYVETPESSMVLDAMDDSPVWCVSELARAELLPSLRRLAMTEFDYETLWRMASSDWDAFHVVPVDGRCLSVSGELAVRFGLRMVDAVHLAAAHRLPEPVRYLTLDHRQIPAAVELGLEVVTPLDVGAAAAP